VKAYYHASKPLLSEKEHEEAPREESLRDPTTGGSAVEGIATPADNKSGRDPN